MPAEEVGTLIAAAEEAARKRVELHTITRTVRDHFDPEERIRMIEMLWEVVYADGSLDDFRSNMMRRVSGLLYVNDRESGEARKRVQAHDPLAGAHSSCGRLRRRLEKSSIARTNSIAVSSRVRPSITF